MSLYLIQTWNLSVHLFPTSTTRRPINPNTVNHLSRACLSDAARPRRPIARGHNGPASAHSHPALMRFPRESSNAARAAVIEPSRNIRLPFRLTAAPRCCRNYAGLHRVFKFSLAYHLSCSEPHRRTRFFRPFYKTRLQSGFSALCCSHGLATNDFIAYCRGNRRPSGQAATALWKVLCPIRLRLRSNVRDASSNQPPPLHAHFNKPNSAQ
jgi:hypothetical protein